MKKMTYESSVKRLEEITGLLEEGKVSLDDSLKLFEEGTKLSAFCFECLGKAEQKIIELSEISVNGDNNDE